MTGSGPKGPQAAGGGSANHEGMQESRASFEAAWRDTKPRLERLLGSRGVTRDVADDVVQETAIKLLSNWQRVDPSRPLWPLARTIALNCLVDQFRTRPPEPIADVPDRAAAYDVEEHGIARARLSVVSDAMASLRPKDRSVLLAEVTADDGNRSSSAYKMARMRARQRLNQALQRSAAAFAGVPLVSRRFVLWVQTASTGAESYAAAVAGAAVAASVALSAVPSPPAADLVRAQRHVSVAAKASDETPEPGGRRAGQSTKKQRPASEPDVPSGRSAVTQEPVTTPPSPEPAEQEETEVARANGKSAKAGRGKGYRYVVVCSEEDSDPTVGVTYFDGEQDEDEEHDHCE